MTIRNGRNNKRAKEKTKKYTITCQDYLNFMNYIVPFCHYIRNTENTFMTGVRSVPSMALLQIVSGEADAQDLDLIIQKKS